MEGFFFSFAATVAFIHMKENKMHTGLAPAFLPFSFSMLTNHPPARRELSRVWSGWTPPCGMLLLFECTELGWRRSKRFPRILHQ